VERTQEQFDRYVARDSGPIGLISLVTVTLLLVTWFGELSPEWRFRLTILSGILWVVLLIDLVILLRLAPNRAAFVGRNLGYVLGVLFPPLRILLIGRVVRFIRTSRQEHLANRITLVVAILAAEVIVLGSLIEVLVERDAPGATILNMGDGIWWGIVTVATVGYGDVVPVTAAGQFVGAMVMLVGISLLSVITANVASRFVKYSRPTTSAADAQSLADIKASLARLESSAALHPGPDAAQPTPDLTK